MIMLITLKQEELKALFLTIDKAMLIDITCTCCIIFDARKQI